MKNLDAKYFFCATYYRRYGQNFDVEYVFVYDLNVYYM